MWFMLVSIPDKVRGTRGTWSTLCNIILLQSFVSAVDYWTFGLYIRSANTQCSDNVLVRSQRCTTNTQRFSDVDVTTSRLKRRSNVALSYDSKLNSRCTMNVVMTICCNFETTTSNSQRMMSMAMNRF